jgi:hypothetical protein
MWENVGTIDRIARVSIGLVLLLVGMFSLQPMGPMAWLIIALGVIILFSGSIGFCALYKLIGINTAEGIDVRQYPSWRYYTPHHQPRYMSVKESRRSYQTTGKGHTAGITRYWVWSQKKGMELRSSGVYKAGHTRR